MAEMIPGREFARREGCDEKLVRQALRDGYLTRDARKRYDAGQVGSGWQAKLRRAGEVRSDGAEGRAEDRAEESAEDAADAEEIAEDRAEDSAVAQSATSAQGVQGEAADDTADGVDGADGAHPLPDARGPDARGAWPKLAESESRRAHFLSLQREAEYRKAVGNLVELSAAREVLFGEFRAARDAWLAWPGKNAAVIAAALGVEPGPVLEVLTRHVRKQIDALAAPTGRELTR